MEDFEQYWYTNKRRILNSDRRYLEAKENFSMSSGADWLLFAIPVVTGIVFMENVEISSEILLWLATAGVVIVCFVLCVFIKSQISDAPDLVSIEETIRKEYEQKFLEGKLDDH